MEQLKSLPVAYWKCRLFSFLCYRVYSKFIFKLKMAKAFIFFVTTYAIVYYS